ncbi:hypothetical protein OG474_26540 [Kribbella sp. NBC_01505]|uniref:hypothetical protein n=1 Tax=Kribbella sp. NBC_01505 TaxID=2903580 RepID=UPI003863D572
MSIAEAAVPAQWKLHQTFPQTTDGLTACLAQVNYYNDNPQYPEVVASECRTGSNRYEHWWKIDN